jgi:hypothetical protein
VIAAEPPAIARKMSFADSIREGTGKRFPVMRNIHSSIKTRPIVNPIGEQIRQVQKRLDGANKRHASAAIKNPGIIMMPVSIEIFRRSENVYVFHECFSLQERKFMAKLDTSQPDVEAMTKALSVFMD